MNARRILAAWALPIALAAAGVVQANVTYSVNLNTTPINSLADYVLAFSFQDGSGVGDNNNTVTLSNFAFGGGSAAGSPVPVGDAVGSLSSTVTLRDTVFSSFFLDGFTPGNSLSFIVDLTTNLDANPAVPDFFGFAILLNGIPLPTQDDTGGDNLLYFNIDSADPTPAPWATSDLSPVALNAPTVAPAQPPEPPGQVPEPGSLWLLTAGLAGLLGIGRRGLSRR